MINAMNPDQKFNKWSKYGTINSRKVKCNTNFLNKMTLEHFRCATKYHRNIIVSQSCTWTFKCVFCNWYFWQWLKITKSGCDIPSNSGKIHLKRHFILPPSVIRKLKLFLRSSTFCWRSPKTLKSETKLKCHLAENCWTANRLVAPSLGAWRQAVEHGWRYDAAAGPGFRCCGAAVRCKRSQGGEEIHRVWCSSFCQHHLQCLRYFFFHRSYLFFLTSKLISLWTMEVYTAVLLLWFCYNILTFGSALSRQTWVTS